MLTVVLAALHGLTIGGSLSSSKLGSCEGGPWQAPSWRFAFGSVNASFIPVRLIHCSVTGRSIHTGVSPAGSTKTMQKLSNLLPVDFRRSRSYLHMRGIQVFLKIAGSHRYLPASLHRPAGTRKNGVYLVLQRFYSGLFHDIFLLITDNKLWTVSILFVVHN